MLSIGLLAAVSSGAACSSAQGNPSDTELGSIISSDGVVYAESKASGAQWERRYAADGTGGTLVGALEGSDLEADYERNPKSLIEQGCDLRLTVSDDVQRTAESLLEQKKGAVVALDAETGSVLCMASSGEDGVNLATRQTVPGSIFKTVTLASALQADTVTLDQAMEVPPSLVFEEGVIKNVVDVDYPQIPLIDAYARSLNTVFAQVALTTSWDSICQTARSLGFDERVAQDIDCDASSIVGEDAMTPYYEAWSGVGLALYGDDGIRRGPLVTPLHMAALFGSFANGGIVYSPYCVAETVAPDGSVDSSQPQVLCEGALDDKVREEVYRAMRLAVEEGTASAAAVPGIEVAGKTGTAEVPTVGETGWFCGCAQSGDRKVSFAVYVENETSSVAVDLSATLLKSSFDEG